MSSLCVVCTEPVDELTAVTVAEFPAHPQCQPPLFTDPPQQPESGNYAADSWPSEPCS